VSSKATVAVADIPKRRRDRRPEQTIRKVLDAAIAEMRESSYANLTVRAVAARAHVSAATAYTYFPSKNALIAEVYLRLIRGVPFYTDVNQSARKRVTAQVRAMALLVADDPDVTAACTVALMADDPLVAPAREKIAAEIFHRITSALGPGWPRDVATALEMTFSGALVTARTGFLSYPEIADRLDKAVDLILGANDEPN
jgi:AcrR family transcriptional regulator